MKNLFTIISITSALLFNSCSNSTQSDENAPDNVNNESAIIEDAATEFESTNNNSTDEIIVDQSEATTTQAPVTAEVKLNPAHGEPGHRCDVNVGDPLPADNAPVGNTIQSTPQGNAPAATSIMNAPANTAPTTTAAGMNPPHGEPGHDCAIPVGAPLNSK